MTCDWIPSIEICIYVLARNSLTNKTNEGFKEDVPHNGLRLSLCVPLETSIENSWMSF